MSNDKNPKNTPKPIDFNESSTDPLSGWIKPDDGV